MHPDFRATHRWFVAGIWAAIAFFVFVMGAVFGAMRLAELWRGH
jgi:hypothetical protein